MYDDNFFFNSLSLYAQYLSCGSIAILEVKKHNILMQHLLYMRRLFIKSGKGDVNRSNYILFYLIQLAQTLDIHRMNKRKREMEKYEVQIINFFPLSFNGVMESRCAVVFHSFPSLYFCYFFSRPRISFSIHELMAYRSK